jgi:MoaA/NifB/PqqE/SkfB family radical SAM enzyme
MLLDPTGGVAVCCRNREPLLGRYPQQSLKDIWNGETIQRLRKALQEHDLSLGCQTCIQKNRKHAFATWYDPYTIAEWPQMLVFEMSNICNLECAMCNGWQSSRIRTNREQLPPLNSPYDAAFLEQISEFLPHLKEAKFFGGEPFLIPIYFDIWKLIKPPTRIFITTNGMVWNSKVKEVLEIHRPDIALSVDALTPEVYSRFRVGGDVDKVLANASEMVPYVESMTLAVCLMRGTVSEIPKLTQYCTERGYGIYFNQVFWPESFSLEHAPEHELAAAVRTLEDGLRGLKRIGYNAMRNRKRYIEALDFLRNLLAGRALMSN